MGIMHTKNMQYTIGNRRQWREIVSGGGRFLAGFLEGGKSLAGTPSPPKKVQEGKRSRAN